MYKFPSPFQFQNIINGIYSLNNSRFFAGIMIILLNIGSRFITIKLSKTQEEFLRNSTGHQILIFAIAWMGTRDIFVALVITAVFMILSQFLLNENSKFCILPKYMKELKSVIDVNNDDELSEEEIKNAISVLKKANEIERKKQNYELMYAFKNDWA
jgi:hypothetical protein